MNRRTIFLTIFTFLIVVFSIENVFASSKFDLTDITIEEKTSTIDAQITSFDIDSVDTNIVFHNLNDYALFKLTIHNNDKKDYKVISVTDNNTNEYVSYEYDSYSDEVFKSKGDLVIYIKSIYDNELDDIEERVQGNDVTFTVHLEDNNGNKSNIDIGINPKTKDDIYFYFALFGFSILVILLILFFRSEEKKKFFKQLGVVAIFDILFISISLFALELGYKVTFNNSFKFNDKVVVTYEIDGVKSTKVIDYNSEAEELEAPDKDGYIFDGWYLGDTKYDFASLVSGDVKLTAKYTKAVYNITYVMNGGNASNPGTYRIDELPLTLNNPVKVGYRFIGWTDQDNVSKEIYTIENESRDLHFEAKYEVNHYTITYKALTDEEKEALGNPDSYTIEDEFTLHNPPNRYEDGDLSEKFVGWKDQNGNISKTVKIKNKIDALEYEATWIHVRPGVYTIVYNLNDGNVTGNPNEYTKNTDTFFLKNPEKDNFTFIGWTGSNGNTPSKKVRVNQGTKGDLEFTAHFEKNTFHITYELDGGEADNPTKYEQGDTFTLERPTKRGYEFTGWTGTDLSGLTLDVTIPVTAAGDREYTAHYQIINYTIDYILNGGTMATPHKTTYTVLEEFTLDTPTKEGNTFNGWTGTDLSSPTIEVTISHGIGNREYTANFSANHYTIKFDKNDDAATGTMEDQDMSYGVSANLRKNAFKKEGYKFVKWTTKKGGGGTAYLDEEEVSNLLESGTITLYAQWDILKIAIFDKGQNVNTKFKIVSGQSNGRYNASNSLIKKIKYSSNVPTEYQTADYKISDSNSQYPIYTWPGENGTIYYGSEADELQLGKDAAYLFNYLPNVTEIDTNFTTSNCLNMTQMFWGAHELLSLDLSHFDTKNVNSMASIFGETYKCTTFGDIKNWDVRNVKSFKHSFNGARSVETLDLSGWYTNSAENMSNMFSSTYVLKTLKIDNFNTSNVTNMHGMINDSFELESVDLSHFDTQKVTDFSGMFSNDAKLKSINVSSFVIITASNKNVNMQNMFMGLSEIEEIDVSSFDTSRVTNFSNMFSKDPLLKTIYVSDKFVTTGISSNPIMFDKSESLVGGSGTTYASSNIRANYAKIDNPPDNPGYFTEK